VLRTRDIYFFLEQLQEQGCFVLKRFYKQRFGFFRNYKIKGGRKLLKTYILETIVPPAPPSISVLVIENLMSAFGFGSSSVPVGSFSVFSFIKISVVRNTCIGGITCLVEKTITLR
jgi:hypothetical protein